MPTQVDWSTFTALADAKKDKVPAFANMALYAEIRLRVLRAERSYAMTFMRPALFGQNLRGLPSKTCL